MKKGKLIVMVGIPGSGKSVISQYMADKNGYYRVSIDEIRHEQRVRNRTEVPLNQVYRIADERIITLLVNGYTVIFEDMLHTKLQRKRVIEKFKNIADIEAVMVVADERKSKKRNLRRDRKVAGNVFDKIVNEFEVPSVDEGFVTVEEVYNLPKKMTYNKKELMPYIKARLV